MGFAGVSAEVCKGSIVSDPHQARAEGKSRVQATIVWELHAGPLHLRCLPVEGGFEVQQRGGKGWTKLSGGPQAAALLRAVVMTPSMAKALA